MTPLEIIGAVVAILIAIGVAMFGCSVLVDTVWRHLDQTLWRMAEKRIRDRAMVMRNQHYWWSTLEQAAVWIACADHMADGHYPDASAVRDRTYARVLKELQDARARQVTRG